MFTPRRDEASSTDHGTPPPIPPRSPLRPPPRPPRPATHIVNCYNPGLTAQASQRKHVRHCSNEKSPQKLDSVHPSTTQLRAERLLNENHLPKTSICHPLIPLDVKETQDAKRRGAGFDSQGDGRMDAPAKTATPTREKANLRQPTLAAEYSLSSVDKPKTTPESRAKRVHWEHEDLRYKLPTEDVVLHQETDSRSRKARRKGSWDFICRGIEG